MRVLWASNSPSSPSGYGVQTNLVTRRLVREGHQVAIASNYGLDGGNIQWPTEYGDITILPKGQDAYSVEVLPHHAQWFNADVILTHYDSWVYQPESMMGRWVPWYPLDTEEYPQPVADKVSHSLLPITQTRDSVEKAARVGIAAEYVPACFDGAYYQPQSRDEWRRQWGVEDRYVVGIVGANQGDPGAPSRKSYPQMFEAFAMFSKQHPAAVLYVHAQMLGHINLVMLAERYRIPPSQMMQATSHSLHSGMYSPLDMAAMYSGLDVLLNPSMGEGFGVPVLEAQACGTRCIVGDWTGMSEVCRSGYKISKRDAFRYPIIGYGDMYLPEPRAICEALVESTDWPHAPDLISEAVQEYEADTVFTTHWAPALAKLQQRVDAGHNTVVDMEKMFVNHAAQRQPSEVAS